MECVSSARTGATSHLRDCFCISCPLIICFVVGFGISFEFVMEVQGRY